MATLTLPWGRLHFESTPASAHAGTPPEGPDTIPFLFLHGSGCSAEDWEPVQHHLPPGTPTVTLDFRGHGTSDVPTEPFSLEDLADDALALLARLGIRRVFLVGHSLGGMVAIAVARRSLIPAGLVLLEGWTSLWAASRFGGDRFFGRLSPERIETIRRQAADVRQRFPPGHWDIFWESVVRFNGYSCLESTPIPVYEVYGSMGRRADTETMLQVPARPSLRWVWLDDAGHYLPAEKPREIAQVCREMAERVQKGMDDHGQVDR